jgi:hypothetical protein
MRFEKMASDIVNIDYKKYKIKLISELGECKHCNHYTTYYSSYYNDFICSTECADFLIQLEIKEEERKLRSCNNCLCNKCIYKIIDCDHYQCNKDGYRGFNWYTSHVSKCISFKPFDLNDVNIGKYVILYEDSFDILGLKYNDFIKFYDDLELDEFRYQGIVISESDGIYEIWNENGCGSYAIEDWNYKIYLTESDLNKIMAIDVSK